MALIRGRLISSSFATDVLPTLPLFAPASPAVRRGMERCGERIEDGLGPASSVRQITDVGLLPLLRLLELTPAAREDTPSVVRLYTACGSDAGPLVIVTGWGESLDGVWRPMVHSAIANDVGWCLCANGLALRAVDTRRTWGREYLEFDLPAALKDERAQSLLWTLLRGDAVVHGVLDEAVAISGQYGVEVCEALGRGVLDALARLACTPRGGRQQKPTVVFDDALTVLYRVLFLLFAEGRGLLPVWHPVYRERYSLDAIVSSLLGGRSVRGLWQAVQAISRLAHAGCTAGELKVNAFNGRLFSPAHAASFDRRPVPDATMREAIVSVSSMPAGRGRSRTRISYRDLDVEQLGAVYEQVLDYEAAAVADRSDRSPRLALVRTRDARKASGAFYTPRALTAFLVRRTLGPLVRDRSADAILRLRIVDPAMGSGAFLVAACQFLAAAAEEALIAEGRWQAHEVTTADRAGLRREIASRCLYGIDVNPMAVQLSRLSLWLVTLAGDKPLSFLDHNLVVGDSLVGAAPADVQRQPGGGSSRARTSRALPLLDIAGLQHTLAEWADVRTRLAMEPDDTAAAVHRKERTLAALAREGDAATHWKRVLDLWCAAWFWPDREPPDRGTFGELVQLLLYDKATLPRRHLEQLLALSAEAAAAHRFLHWTLAFPEVFAGGGFDAVVGNPPWDMVRGDSGTTVTRDVRQRQARDANAFFRDSGVYSVTSRAHANRYQLFVERALQVVRPHGRIGFVLPAGIVSDAGSAALRRLLLDRADVESITGMDNRDGIFPIHRSVRFVLVTATHSRPTSRIVCRFGLTRAEELEEMGEGRTVPLSFSRELLTQLSGAEDLGIPELRSEQDLRIVEGISARVPRLDDAGGWHAQFGRELNATDDRDAFAAITRRPGARPVIEGKQLDPFRVHVGRSRQELRADAAVGRRIPRRVRLAYRDVASATNRLTLIAAVLPADVVTTHTIFCLKTPLAPAQQHVLCALLNSFVANYLIRLRVSTHVTVSLMSQLRVPFVEASHPAFARLRDLAHALSYRDPVESAAEYAELQAIAAHLYGLSASEFEHVLNTFPLIPEHARRRSVEMFVQEWATH